MFCLFILFIAVTSSLAAYFFAHKINTYSKRKFQENIPIDSTSPKELNIENTLYSDLPLSAFPSNYDEILSKLELTLNQSQKSELLNYGKVIIKPSDFNKSLDLLNQSQIPIVLNNNTNNLYTSYLLNELETNIYNDYEEKYISILTNLQKQQNSQLSKFDDSRIQECINKNLLLITEALNIFNNEENPIDSGVKDKNDAFNIFSTDYYKVDDKKDYASLVLITNGLKKKHNDQNWSNLSFVNNLISRNNYLIDFNAIDKTIQSSHKNSEQLEPILLEIINSTNAFPNFTYDNKVSGLYDLYDKEESESIKNTNNVETKLNVLNSIYTKQNFSIQNKDQVITDPNIYISDKTNTLNDRYMYVKLMDLASENHPELFSEEVKNTITNLKTFFENIELKKLTENLSVYEKVLNSTNGNDAKAMLIQAIKINDKATLAISPLLIPNDIDTDLKTNIKDVFGIEYSADLILNSSISDNNFSDGYDYPVISQINGSTRVPILMYHQIASLTGNKTQDAYYVSPEMFEKQIAYLVQKNYKSLSIDEYIELLQSGKNPTQKSVLLTLDDGNANNYTTAYPILKKYGLKATFFIVSGSLNISAASLKEMSDSGMDIESHTASHRDLTKLNDSEISFQFSASKEILESITEKPVKAVSYPYCGANSPVITNANYAGYTLGITCGGQIDAYWSQKMIIPRVQIYNDFDNFVKRLSGNLEAANF